MIQNIKVINQDVEVVADPVAINLAKMNNHKTLGFTLLELIISIAIIGIIASYAIPSYQQAILKSHRSDAISALLHLQMEQEQWRIKQLNYATLEQLNINKITENGFYKLSDLLKPNKAQFLVIAKPIKQQQKDSCGSFAINQFGAVYNNYANQQCWGE